MNKDLKTLIARYPKRSELVGPSFSILREDGINLYRSDDQQSQSIDALMAGVWQAAQTVSQEDVEANPNFRLSFENSSQGFFIYPLKVDEFRLFLGVVYKKVLNPGKLKNEFRLFKEYLEQNYKLEKIESMETASVKVEQQGQKLFSNISDDEIDNLFSFVST